MSIFEKLFSIVYLLYMLTYSVAFVILNPELYLLLLPYRYIGILLAVVMSYIVIRDVYRRSDDEFNPRLAKPVWIMLTLVAWPALVYYLVNTGFKAHKPDEGKRGTARQGRFHRPREG